jgi:cell division septation protein DedD
LAKKTAFATLIGTSRSELEVNTQIRQISEQGFSPYVVKGANGEFYLYVGAFYTYRGAKEQYADLLASGIESKVVERYSSPPKEISAVSLPSKDENHIREDAAQEKLMDSRSPGPNEPASSGEANVPELTKESRVTTGNLNSEEPVSDNEQKPVSAISSLKTETLETIGASEQSTESVKLLYPYSIKLTYFRSREDAEKSLAVYRAKGLSPYWVKVNIGDQGVWYRVFAGYFEDIAAAEEIIKTHKLRGALVKKTAFATLIGTSRSELEVNTQIRQISDQGFSPYVVKGANGEFYLYVGAFYTYRGAKEQYADLLASGIESKVVER